MAVSSPKRIHPSFASPSTRPLFPRSRSFVARNENKRDVLFSFHLFVSCRASWIGRARAKRGEVPSACVTSLEEISKSAPTDAADVAARTTTRSRNERRSERTQHYFLLPFLLHPRVVRVRRVAECRAVSPCRPSYTRRLVVSNRRFSRLPRFSRKQTRVEIATLTRDDERTRTFKRDKQKGSWCAALFFLNFLCVVVVRHRRSERGEDVPHARNESSHRFRSVKQRPASTLVVVANGAEEHHRRR